MSLTPLLTTPLLAFGVTVITHLCALRIFPCWGLLDFPERYGLLRARLPYPTGILALIVFSSFFVYLEPKTMHSVGLLVAIFLLGLFCFLDDRQPLNPLLRLGIQICIAILLFATGTRIYSLTNPLASITGAPVIALDRLTMTVAFVGSLPVLSGVFTTLWLGLTINALNWFDGIPGQVTILSAIGFFTIGMLSLSARVNQPDLAIIAFVLAGIAGGCLLFDIPPPKVVLGDSGAMFFGLMIGVLTIYSGGKVATAFLVLGVPLIDFALVIARRLRKGTSIFRGNAGNEHLHHRLLAKGWRPRQVILLTASIGAAFGITALFLNTFGKFIAAFVLFLLMLGLSWYSAPRSGSLRSDSGQAADQ